MSETGTSVRIYNKNVHLHHLSFVLAPLLSSAGTDNEAQGEVTEQTDSRFALEHDCTQKRVSRVNAAVYDRPRHSLPYGFADKQGEMASCGISAPVI